MIRNVMPNVDAHVAECTSCGLLGNKCATTAGGTLWTCINIFFRQEDTSYTLIIFNMNPTNGRSLCAGTLDVLILIFLQGLMLLKKKTNKQLHLVLLPVSRLLVQGALLLWHLFYCSWWGKIHCLGWGKAQTTLPIHIHNPVINWQCIS